MYIILTSYYTSYYLEASYMTSDCQLPLLLL